MLAETEKIEAYILKNCGGHIRAAYGCSLGGSFVGLLACYPYKWAQLVKSILQQGV